MRNVAIQNTIVVLFSFAIPIPPTALGDKSHETCLAVVKLSQYDSAFKVKSSPSRKRS